MLDIFKKNKLMLTLMSLFAVSIMA